MGAASCPGPPALVLRVQRQKHRQELSKETAHLGVGSFCEQGMPRVTGCSVRKAGTGIPGQGPEV